MISKTYFEIPIIFFKNKYGTRLHTLPKPPASIIGLLYLHNLASAVPFRRESHPENTPYIHLPSKLFGTIC